MISRFHQDFKEGVQDFKRVADPSVLTRSSDGVGYIFRNGTEVAVVAYLDCIHDRVSIIFIVFIGNTLLPGFSTY